MDNVLRLMHSNGANALRQHPLKKSPSSNRDQTLAIIMHVNEVYQILTCRPSHFLFLYHIAYASHELLRVPSFYQVDLCLCNIVLPELAVVVHEIGADIQVGLRAQDRQAQCEDVALFSVVVGDALSPRHTLQLLRALC